LLSNLEDLKARYIRTQTLKELARHTAVKEK
jgi:hypothetical protein